LFLKYFVLAMAVVLVFLAIHGIIVGASFFDIEPFSALFLLIGDGPAFIFLGVVLVSSLFYNRSYCSYVCPAGAGLSLAGLLRIREINRWPECSECRICEAECPTGAISGAKISTLECMDCRTCEANYLNISRCPHYAFTRASQAAQLD
jgi:NosR/NirI family nitrous oxide reductase transcriptional regulator